MDSQDRSARRGRRQGAGALFGALGLLLLLTVMAFVQRQLSRQAVSEVHRSQLVTLARSQARNVLEEMVGGLGQAANEPGTPLFRRIRWSLDEPFDTLDLTADLPPSRTPLTARWGNLTNGAEAEASFQVSNRWARLSRRRPCYDERGTEEWVAVLEVGTQVVCEDAADRVERTLEAAYELRTMLLAPPRPFDQLGLFLGRPGSLIDAARVNQIRDAAVQGHLALRSELQSADTSALSGDDKRWLRQIVEGMLTAEDLENRVPRLPDGEAVLYGFLGEVREFQLRELDLVARLEAIQARLDARKAAYQSAPPDRSRYEQAYWMVDEYSNVFDAIWQSRSWATRILERDSDRFRELFEPYLHRLTPRYFLERVSLSFHEEDPLYHAWRSMGRRLEGVVDLSHWSQRIELEAELQGRVVLLVGPGGATLRDLNWSTGAEGHRLVLVSLGGEVVVEGQVRASVIMLPGADGSPTGSFRLGSGAHLRGGLLLPEPGTASVVLEGILEYDGFFRASYPPRNTLTLGTRGEYVVTLGPQPLWSKEGRP